MVFNLAFGSAAIDTLAEAVLIFPCFLWMFTDMTYIFDSVTKQQRFEGNQLLLFDPRRSGSMGMSGDSLPFIFRCERKFFP
ncbi:hypothetical protein Y032_0900g2950 [Ancylostoma ceylanicum]|uniref:Uncharacterized protein n=1 Tax=Ancylostoma ceylanicum TaxID=53326 RepID=A0A016W9U2_9BILA|nr:hypothetical protein Y032_0900g2950 [Ancylostoma ceylanicum]